MKNPFAGIRGIKMLKNELLIKHTSFRIGGYAKYYINVYSRKSLHKILVIIKREKMKYLVIGAGTNLLFSDNGFPGVVIRLCGIFTKIRREKDFFYCGGGMLIDTFLRKTCEAGYGGAEFAAGIPGTIGGGIKGNAGAFGESFSDITEEITVIDEKNAERDLTNDKIGFDYRKSKIKNGVIIMSAKIKLFRANRKDILAAIRKNLIMRANRQPVGFSAGSFFKNPLPYSAGKLIEECGLKGLEVGDAIVSTRHANWIINRGGAKASDIIRLAKIIKETVKRKKGILLKEEVKILN